jgi:hypothetical protein
MVDISEHTRWNIERETVELFLKSRKNDETRDYTRGIIAYLSDQFDQDFKKSGDLETAGWVRTKDLIKKVTIIPNQSTFFQLLKNLVEAKMIEKKSEYIPKLATKPGKKPVYYRVPYVYNKEMLRTFQTKESLVEELNEAYAKIVDIGYRLEAATQLLRQCHDKKYDSEKAIMQLALEMKAEEEQTYRITQ